MKLTAVFQLLSRLAIALWVGFCAQGFSQTRIVSTSPSLTELIFQLGHGNQIVGTSQHSDYPEAAKAIPRIGTLLLPSVEKILYFHPDSVLVDMESTPKNLVTQLEKLKINCFKITIQTVSDLFEQSQKILTHFFNENHNDQILNFSRHFTDNKLQIKKNFSFIILAWPNPMYFIGRHTFLSDLLTQFGGSNLISPKITASYPQVSEEWLIKNPPEILFILGDNEEQKIQTERVSRRLWPQHKTKVIFLPSDKFARTSFTALEFLPDILKREL